MKILFIRHAETQINIDKLAHKTEDLEYSKDIARTILAACLF